MGKSLKIERQNGNIPKTLAGEDHISGFMAYVNGGDVPEGWQAERIQALSSIERAEAAGITADSEKWSIRVLHYHLSEIYRTNPGVSLYVGLFDLGTGNPTFAEVKQMQNFARKKLRQIAIWNGTRPLQNGDDLTTLQGVADTLTLQAGPLVMLYAPKVTKVTQLSQELAGGNKSRVSVVIGQAGSGTGAELYADRAGNGASVSCLGTVLGLLSRAKVHECIAGVKQFPTGISTAAFSDGTHLHELDSAVVEALDAARYLFLTYEEGQSGTYLNDSHNMDSAISDYASIESVRTMDKAERGVRAYLTPELASNVYVDASTGKLTPASVAHLETTAGLALEQMERAGELSGYKAEVNPEQDVMSSSRVEVVLKNVSVPVMRHIAIKMGYVKSV